MVIVKFKKMTQTCTAPRRATAGAAGYDLCADTVFSIVIDPGQRTLVPTGIAIELPQGYEAQVRSRSGLTLKSGVVVANGIGTIDEDFRGVVGVILLNTSDTPYVVNHGDRIAQMVIS